MLSNTKNPLPDEIFGEGIFFYEKIFVRSLGISEGTGDIIAQQEVPVEPIDTGETLYRKLERASLTLFQETWPLIKAGRAPRIPQNKGVGTYHRTRDVESIDKIQLDQQYKARDLINILRARTFPPYKGAYFEVGGKRVYMYLRLEYGEEDD